MERGLGQVLKAAAAGPAAGATLRGPLADYYMCVVLAAFLSHFPGSARALERRKVEL